VDGKVTAFHAIEVWQPQLCQELREKTGLRRLIPSCDGRRCGWPANRRKNSRLERARMTKQSRRRVLKQSAAAAFGILAGFHRPIGAQPVANGAVTAVELPMRVSARHGISATVIPGRIGAEVKSWEFLVAFQSHQHGFAERLPQQAVLLGPHRSEERLIEWEARPPEGFIRQGVARFAAIQPFPTSIELSLQVRGEHGPRIFRWNLN
jgi:hypothetical protein